MAQYKETVNLLVIETFKIFKHHKYKHAHNNRAQIEVSEILRKPYLIF